MRTALGLAALALAAIACNAVVGFGDLTKVPAGDEPNVTTDDDDLDDDDGDDDDSTGSVDSGASSSGSTPACNVTAAFGAPVALEGPVNTGDFENAPSLTDDELTIVFQRSTGANNSTLWTATRANRTAAFGAPAKLALTASNNSFVPSIARDGLTLFWAEATTAAGMDIFFASRNTVSAPFANPLTVTASSSTLEEFGPAVTADGEELFFSSNQGSPQTDERQIHRATRDLGEFKNPQRVTELDSDGDEQGIAISRDGLTIFFGSTRTGGAGGHDVWTARRNQRSEKFGAATVVASVSSAQNDFPAFISADGCRLYLGSERGGGGDLYVATRPP